VPLGSGPRIVDYLEAECIYRGWAGQVRRIPGARLVTNPRFRNLLPANQLLVGPNEPAVPWDEIEREAEPTLRGLGVPGRRVMLFGRDVEDRLGFDLVRAGFRRRPLYMLSYAGFDTTRERPGIAVRIVDPFSAPARYALRYRIEREDRGPTPEAAERARLFLEEFHSDRRRTLVAFVGNEFTGAGDLVPVGSLAAIVKVETLPEWRGQGVAQAVVRRATEEAFEGGAEGVYLNVISTNLEHGLYRPLGFERIAEIGIFERRGNVHDGTFAGGGVR
jgi:ribosomal protein S18 acetylase RimI-like enzyme